MGHTKSVVLQVLFIFLFLAVLWIIIAIGKDKNRMCGFIAQFSLGKSVRAGKSAMRLTLCEAATSLYIYIYISVWICENVAKEISSTF